MRETEANNPWRVRTRETIRTAESWKRLAATATTQALPVVILLVLGYRRRWLSDDAYIDLRVVRNLLDGHGPVYNLGERVEAYTNPLWVAILTAWGLVGLPIELGAWLLGLCFAAAGLIFAQLAAARLSRALAQSTPRSGQASGRARAWPLGTLIMVALPPVWDFSTSGLETGLSLCWMGAAFWLLTRHCLCAPASSRWILLGVVLGIGPLIRPDLAVFSAAFIAAVAVFALVSISARSRQALAIGALLVAAASAPLSYQVFRMGYFASLVPNTALAKEASQANWPQGLTYGADFLGTYLLWLPLALVLIWWTITAVRLIPNRNWAVVALWVAPVVAAILHALYVLRVGGDFMHGRMLIPSLFGLMLPLSVVRLRPPTSRGWRFNAAVGASAIIVVWAVICAFWLRVPYAGRIGPDGITDERGFYVRSAGNHNPVSILDYRDMMFVKDANGLNELVNDVERGIEGPRLGIAMIDEPLAVKLPLKDDLPADVRVVALRRSIGLVGYVTGVTVHLVDRLGLGDPLASRLELPERVQGRTGHEKLLPTAWAVARFADPNSVPAEFPDVHAAQSALACGDIRALLDGIEQPLTAKRFLRNLALSWHLRGLRIPQYAADAEDHFCSPP